MGFQLFDQFALLHFAVGIIAYFWGLSFRLFFLIHTLFEITENTPAGINLINNYVTFWPGGKPSADSLVNMAGDSFASVAGWYCAYFLDFYGTQKGWYFPHLVEKLA